MKAFRLLSVTVVFALLLNYVRRKSKIATDTLISVFSSTAIAIGLVVLSKYGGISKYSSYLVGDILSIAPYEILILLVTLLMLVFHLTNAYPSLETIGAAAFSP